MPRFATILALAAPLACSRQPDPDPATFAEHCGVTTPVRLLELAPNQAVAASLRVGDRLYHTVGVPSIYTSDSPGVPPESYFSDTAVWTTGPCGESPAHLADAIDAVFTLERWPDLALGCQENLGVVALDPTGEASPHLIFPIPDCSFGVSDHGLVRLAASPDDASLVLYPFPDDPRTETADPQVLLADVKYGIGSGYQVWPDAVHVIDADATLQRIDLADRSVTAEQTQVLSFRLSADRRYLLWADYSTYVPGSITPVVVTLGDRMTGVGVAIGETTIAFAPHALRWADQGLLVFGTIDAQRVFFLPALNFVDLPRGFEVDPEGPLADGSWPIVNRSAPKRAWLERLDLQTGTSEPLFSRRGQLKGRDPDAAIVLDVASCCAQSNFNDEGPVWRVPFDGASTDKLASRASYFTTRLGPDRLLTAVDVSDEREGTLLLVDDGDEYRISDDVFISGLPLAPADDPTLLTYTVRDGERSEVWTARLPPP